jgi:hypothetical protein
MSEKTDSKTRRTKPIMAVAVHCLVRRLRCLIEGHRTYSYKATGEFAITRDEDDMATAQCVVCGKTLRAPCGIMLPGFRLGTAPISPPNVEVKRGEIQS